MLRLDIEGHRRWMIRNYALTFAAVTLRMYLPAAAQDLLFNRIQGLAAPGSRVGVEDLTPDFADPAARAQRRERCNSAAEIGEFKARKRNCVAVSLPIRHVLRNFSEDFERNIEAPRAPV